MGKGDPQVTCEKQTFATSDLDYSHSTQSNTDGRVSVNLNSALARTLSRLAKGPTDSTAPDEALPPAYTEESWNVRLNVVIHVVGSRGDVQPFVALGAELQRTGHRVRLATHEIFRKFVQDAGLEFYPIGGDPAELMAYMVKNPGLLPGMDTLRSGEIAKKRAIIALMLEGCWKSCYSPDPDTQAPFVANAIIANPPSFAHVHCAQALGIPLHMMFTMPWSSTTAFPHPLANVVGSQVGEGQANYLSYHFVSWMTWQGLADIINAFRKDSLGLEPVPLSEGPFLIERLRVPFTYCWSPALIPRPKDWPEQIDVCGFFFRQQPTFSPSTALNDFLKAGRQPVYIGFGSIVVDDPVSLTEVTLQAVKLAGVRAIVSAGWSSLASETVSDDVFFLEGDCPHEWLFQQVATVVHHGGAGTTACGLRYGCPTVVVPFFGDQPFWGDMVYRAGAGPRPIPHRQLDAQNLSEAILFCLNSDVKQAVQSMSKQMMDNDGVRNAVGSFHRHMSLRGMSCDLLPQYPATWLYTGRGQAMKLSGCAMEVLVERGIIQAGEMELYAPKALHINQRRWDPATGVIASMGETTMDMLLEVNGLWKRPYDLQKKQDAAEEKRSGPVHAAAMVGASLSAAPRFVASMFKGFVVDLPNAATEGLRVAPRLYGEHVPEQLPVTDWKSGGVVAGKNFLENTRSGLTDIMTQPVTGYQEGGTAGLMRGVGKGLAGSATKTASAFLGLVAYPGQGLVKSLHSLTHQKTRKLLVNARQTEAKYQMGEKPVSQWLAGRIVDGFYARQNQQP